MAKALCDLQFKLSTPKRKRGCRNNTQLIPSGNFPTPRELVSLNDKTLNQRCNLGYRASNILRLAQQIQNGTLKLSAFEENYDLQSTEELYRKLLSIKGFGPFACANVMMCIGFYQKIPVDTETIKHLKEVHGMKFPTKRATTVQIYDKYEPFQCLAYWMERVDYYEKRFGKLSELPPSNYGNVTGSYIGPRDSEGKVEE
ncbi:Uncharacterized protein Adt_40429 [Abeliophyllum distichum]